MTVWPAFTSTAVTVPDTAKLRVAWLAGSIVPELATVCWIVPVVTGTVTVVTESPKGAAEPGGEPEGERDCRRDDDNADGDQGPPIAPPERRRRFG